MGTLVNPVEEGARAAEPKHNEEAEEDEDEHPAKAGDGDGEDEPKEAKEPGEEEDEKTKRMDENERRLRMLGYRDVEEVVEAFIKANTKRKRRRV